MYIVDRILDYSNDINVFYFEIRCRWHFHVHTHLNIRINLTNCQNSFYLLLNKKSTRFVLHLTSTLRLAVYLLYYKCLNFIFSLPFFYLMPIFTFTFVSRLSFSFSTYHFLNILKIIIQITLIVDWKLLTYWKQQ